MSTSSSAAALPPTSFRSHDYRWRLANAKDLARSWIRTAFGAEAWFGRRGYLLGTDGTIHITTTLCIWSTGISLVDLEYRISRALVHLRFHHPEVACRALRLHKYDYPGCPPEVVYTLAKDATDVAAWASRIIHRAKPPLNGLKHSSTFKVSKKDIPPLSSVKIFSVLGTQHEEAELEVGSHVMLVFVFHPVLWDGVSSHTFVGDLLRCIGDLWSAGAPGLETLRQYDWGTETDNLASSILEACGADVSEIGHEFARERDKYIRKLKQGTSGWGLPVNSSRGKSQIIRRSISIPQSHTLKLVMKHLFGPDYTLTHLGHAAMLLALLRVSPMPPDFPDSAAVVSPMLINGRRYLKGKDDYRRYGSCLATAFVDFAPLSQ
ncbi:uncharacterized protein GLRG_08179 [Colletotrichum graminicola M1.001]|uniref:Uncharacterized protein n=1 Tax=Colletotrichum graminicola (strain M1.001 / M2 / FGSC 10212) TaxID=645133 RepID=E3QQ97_COLGM|nr:uncharacterized protein GLRG_08179 [Colletotrichum graminicola M1.001]EFQ33035.1 hypothetical protein GLRG_08179 [Colletotrichum graminicola M1.001]